MDANSEAKLLQVHPDLVRIIRATSQVYQPFQVVYGIRTLVEEHEAVATGHSTTMHSRHLPNKKGLSCAVDVAAIIKGKLSFAPGLEASVFGAIAHEVMLAARVQNVPVEWGGNWNHFKDWGHFQLPWEPYP